MKVECTFIFGTPHCKHLSEITDKLPASAFTGAPSFLSPVTHILMLGKDTFLSDFTHMELFFSCILPLILILSTEFGERDRHLTLKHGRLVRVSVATLLKFGFKINHLK